jgi:pectinesterase
MSIVTAYIHEQIRVVFSNSKLGSHINPAGWSEWLTSSPNTDHVLFGEYGNTGL